MASDSENIVLLYESLKKMKQPSEIAKKHKVSEEVVKKALEKGRKVEMEHCTDYTTARTIASHHLWEAINYYDKLEKMEKSLKKD